MYVKVYSFLGIPTFLGMDLIVWLIQGLIEQTSLDNFNWVRQGVGFETKLNISDSNSLESYIWILRIGSDQVQVQVQNLKLEILGFVIVQVLKGAIVK